MSGLITGQKSLLSLLMGMHSVTTLPRKTWGKAHAFPSTLNWADVVETDLAGLGTLRHGEGSRCAARAAQLRG